MRAVVLEKLNQPLSVSDLSLPNLSYGQVMVHVLCSTICGKQIGEITGAFGEDKHLPHLLGHEGCGEVVEVGSDVSKVQIGDRVVMHWRKGSGVNASPPVYSREGEPDNGYRTYERVGAGPVASFGDLVVVSENRLTVVDKDLPPRIGSLFGCAVTTALGLINNEARLKIGQSIAVAGCGGVGLNIIQGAAMVSANPIISIDYIGYKLGMAQMFGATHVIDDSREEMRSAICKIVGSRGVDVFVDCTGNTVVIGDGYEAVAPGGKMILVGQTPVGSHWIFRNAKQHYCGKTLLDSQGGLTDPDVDIPRYVKLYQSGKLTLDPLITHSFSLDDINSAMNLVKSGHCGRVALEMQ